VAVALQHSPHELELIAFHETVFVETAGKFTWAVLVVCDGVLGVMRLHSVNEVCTPVLDWSPLYAVTITVTL
jgi:hypothetical protein